jgi:hypothetical protein
MLSAAQLLQQLVVYAENARAFTTALGSRSVPPGQGSISCHILPDLLQKVHSIIAPSRTKPVDTTQLLHVNLALCNEIPEDIENEVIFNDSNFVPVVSSRQNLCSGEFTGTISSDKENVPSATESYTKDSITSITMSSSKDLSDPFSELAMPLVDLELERGSDRVVESNSSMNEEESGEQ